MEAFAKNCGRLVEEGGKALAAYLKPREEGQIKSEMPEEVADVVKTLGQVVEYWLRDPQRAFELQAGLAKDYLELWAAASKRLAGEDAPPIAAPDPKDRRFADPEWTTNQFFDFLKQAYLLTTRWADHLVKGATSLDSHTKQKAEFYVRQIANAISPSNFVLTNPELLRQTLSSNADNLVRGMHMLARGHRGGWRQPENPSVRHGDVRGRPQPGDHARQGDLSERADAAASSTRRRPTRCSSAPLLIVPPWINKFYILDLTPEKSFIKWCVDQGLTVFVISWVNPDERLAAKSFEEYMHEGPLEALERHRAGDRRAQGQRHRLLRRRHAAVGHPRLHGGEGRRAHHVGDPVRRAGRLHLCGRPQGVRRRGTDAGARTPDGRAGLSRGLEDGERLQHAALERPDLALRDRQLSQGQGAASRSTCCTGIPIRRACRRRTTRSICAIATCDNNARPAARW